MERHACVLMMISWNTCNSTGNRLILLMASSQRADDFLLVISCIKTRPPWSLSIVSALASNGILIRGDVSRILFVSLEVEARLAKESKSSWNPIMINVKAYSCPAKEYFGSCKPVSLMLSYATKLMQSLFSTETKAVKLHFSMELMPQPKFTRTHLWHFHCEEG